MKLADTNTPACAAYGFIMVLISHSHEDENTDLMLSLSVRVNSVFGRYYKVFRVGSDSSFCGISSSSNTVQGSVLLPHYRTLEVRPG